MKNRFIAKKKKGTFLLKSILWLSIATMTLVITFNILLKTTIAGLLGEDELHKNLFQVGTNQKNFLSLDLLNPSDLFKLGLNYKIDYEPSIPVDELKLISKHENDENPLVYIYSTHESETYDSSLVEAYNIKYNVTTGGYILSDYLKDLGIPSYVEKESMADYLHDNGLNYSYSYYASAHYMKKRIEEHPSIRLVIDIHRDALPRYASVASIDGKNYAKVLFVVATDYDGFEKNVAFAEKLNSHLPSAITRGLSKGNGYPPIDFFNQNLKENAILLEIGGTENTIEEVANTMNVVAKAIFETFEEEGR